MSSFKKEGHSKRASLRTYDMALIRRVKKRKIPTLRQFLSISSILSPWEKLLFFVSVCIFVISSIWGGSLVSNAYGVDVPKVNGSYTEGVLGSPKLINPLFSQLNDVDEDLVKLVYSGLLRYDASRRLVSDLSVTYDISEDGKEYIFELKQGVLWHDGEKFTADDVVFTFDMIQDSKVSSPLSVSFMDISVEALDDYHVKFKLQEAFPAFLSTLTVGILPKHIWSQIPVDQVRLAQRNLQPIGTGPFFFNRLVKNDSGFIYRIELKRFEDYYLSSPFIEDFALEFFSEYEGQNGLVTALREQKIDGINFVPFEYREKVKRKHTKLYTLQLPQYTALFFNLDRETVEEKDVRTALGGALDKERIVKDVLENEAKMIYGPILEGFPGYDSKLATQAISIDEVNELLDAHFDRISAEDYRKMLKDAKVIEMVEAQKKEQESVQTEETNTEEINSMDTLDTQTEIKTVEDNPIASTTIDTSAIEALIDQQLDQQLHTAQLFYRYPKSDEDKTNIVQIKLVTAATPEYAKVAELIVGYWQDVGISVDVRLVDPKDMAREVLKNRDYDVLLYGIIIGSDPDQYPFWHSKQVKYPGLNLSGYINRDTDDLLEKIRETTDKETLNTSYGDLQKKILEDTPAIFLYTPTYTYALTDAIQGFSTLRISHPSDRFSQVTEWYMDTKKVWKIN